MFKNTNATCSRNIGRIQGLLPLTSEDVQLAASKYDHIVDLENFFWFNPRLFISKSHAGIAGMLFQLKHLLVIEFNITKKIYMETLENIIVNLMVAVILGKVIAISASPGMYLNQKLYGLKHYSYRKIKLIISLLLKNGYIHKVPGYFSREINRGKTTRILPSVKFRDSIFGRISKNINSSYPNDGLLQYVCLSAYDAVNTKPYENPIILKDDNSIISYEDTDEIILWRKQLIDYNEFISNVVISWSGGQADISKIKLLMTWDKLKDHLDYTQVTRWDVTNQTVRAQMDTPPSYNATPITDAYIRCDSTTTTNKPNNNFFAAESLSITSNISPEYIYNLKLHGYLHRVFNKESFNLGGRFYGAQYQNIPQEFRPSLLINGNETIELDYSGFHFQMLYNISGKQLNGDPYLIKGIPFELRTDFFKSAGNILINAPTRNLARGAIYEYLEENHDIRRLFYSHYRSIDNAINDFHNAHPDISGYFNSGIGLTLQNYDSQIANNILNHFTWQGKVCLCMHDSFLVEKQYQDELEEMMKEFYFRKFGFKCGVKVKG